MKQCRQCRKLLDSGRQLCDCGAYFAGNEPEVQPTPAEEQTLSESRARRALKWGLLGWIPWLGVFLLPLFLGSRGGGSPNYVAGLLVVGLVGWTFLCCGIGSLIALGRSPAAFIAVRGLWTAALLLNYGFFALVVLVTLFGVMFGSRGPISGYP